MGIVVGAASSACTEFMGRPITPPAAIAEPMNSRRDKSSSLAMCSPEKEQPKDGMLANKAPSAEEIRACQADHVVMHMVMSWSLSWCSPARQRANGNTSGARHSSLRPPGGLGWRDPQSILL